MTIKSFLSDWCRVALQPLAILPVDFIYLHHQARAELFAGPAGFQHEVAGSSPSPTLLQDAYTSRPENFRSRPTLPECGTNILYSRRPRGTNPKLCDKPRPACLR